MCDCRFCCVQRKGPLEFARSDSQSSSLAGRLSKVLSYLQDHFSPSHAFHHYLRVAGRSLPHHLGPDGGQVQENHLQRVSVQQQLQEFITPCYSGPLHQAPLTTIYIITQHPYEFNTSRIERNPGNGAAGAGGPDPRNRAQGHTITRGYRSAAFVDFNRALLCWLEMTYGSSTSGTSGTDFQPSSPPQDKVKPYPPSVAISLLRY